MAAGSIQVSLSPELHTAVQKRVRSGRYRDASDVFRAGLRALEREESEAAWQDWRKARAGLPAEGITLQIQDEIESRIRMARRKAQRKDPT